MSNHDGVQSKIAALMQFKPADQDAASRMLGLTQQQIDEYQSSRPAPDVIRQDGRGSLSYPSDWPAYANTFALWTYLKGDKLHLDDPFNGEELLSKVKTGMCVLNTTLQSAIPSPNAALYPFWGYDIRRERLPLVTTYVDMSTIALPVSKSSKSRASRYICVVKWLYPNYVNAEQVWYTICQNNVALAAIIRELSKIVGIEAFYWNSIGRMPMTKKRVSESLVRSSLPFAQDDIIGASASDTDEQQVNKRARS